MKLSLQTALKGYVFSRYRLNFLGQNFYKMRVKSIKIKNQGLTFSNNWRKLYMPHLFVNRAQVYLKLPRMSSFLKVPFYLIKVGKYSKKYNLPFKQKDFENRLSVFANFKMQRQLKYYIKFWRQTTEKKPPYDRFLRKIQYKLRKFTFLKKRKKKKFSIQFWKYYRNLKRKAKVMSRVLVSIDFINLHILSILKTYYVKESNKRLLLKEKRRRLKKKRKLQLLLLKKKQKQRFHSFHPKFSFVRSSLVFNYLSLFSFKYFRPYFLEYKQINNFLLDFYRLNHANIYTWGAHSYKNYMQYFKQINFAKKHFKFNRLSTFFFKKKIGSLNIKFLNFYRLTNALFLRNKYNYFFPFKIHHSAHFYTSFLNLKYKFFNIKSQNKITHLVKFLKFNRYNRNLKKKKVKKFDIKSKFHIFSKKKKILKLALPFQFRISLEKEKKQKVMLLQKLKFNKQKIKYHTNISYLKGLLTYRKKNFNVNLKKKNFYKITKNLSKFNSIFLHMNLNRLKSLLFMLKKKKANVNNNSFLFKVNLHKILISQFNRLSNLNYFKMMYLKQSKKFITKLKYNFKSHRSSRGFIIYNKNNKKNLKIKALLYKNFFFPKQLRNNYFKTYNVFSKLLPIDSNLKKKKNLNKNYNYILQHSPVLNRWSNLLKGSFNLKSEKINQYNKNYSKILSHNFIKFSYFIKPVNTNKFYSLFLKKKRINSFFKNKVNKIGLNKQNFFSSILKPKFKFIYKNMRMLLANNSNYIQSITPNVSYYKKESEALSKSHFYNNNINNNIGKLFFFKLLAKFNYSISFIKKFLYQFNNRLFIFVIKFFLVKKYMIKKKYGRFSEISQIVTTLDNYTLFQAFLIKSGFSLFHNIVNKDVYLLKKKNEFISISNKRVDLKLLNYNQIKLNLFIIYLNLLIKYRLDLYQRKRSARLLIIAFRLQKILWLKSKQRSYFNFLKKFNIKKKTKKIQYKKKSLSVLTKREKFWRTSYWNHIQKYFKKLSLSSINQPWKKNSNATTKFYFFKMRFRLKMIGASYFYLSFFFKWHLTRLFFKKKNESVFIRFNILFEPSAFLIGKHICRSLRRGFQLKDIVNNLLWTIPSTFPDILAMQIKCVGRHTRKERANRDWFRKGSLRMSNIKSNVDYASTGVVLKYGYTNVKVWLFKKTKKSLKLGLKTSFI